MAHSCTTEANDVANSSKPNTTSTSTSNADPIAITRDDDHKSDQESTESWQEPEEYRTDEPNQTTNDHDKNDTNDASHIEQEQEFEKDLAVALKHKAEGNNYYKQTAYDQALREYTLAIDHCPTDSDKDKENLSIFYANRAACHIAMEEWEEAVEECTLSIEHNDEYIKSFWRRGRAYEKLEKYFDAKRDYERILEIDPKHEISKANLARIEPLVQQQFEKQKEEVVDKLKGFANWGLGKLGLSLDNFEAQQNPETGAYNINFKQSTGQ